jgi:hypothetical protein
MSDTTITPTLVILPGATWRAELTDELIRLGVAEDRAPISAGKVLGAICRHAGYLNCFEVASSDGDEPLDLEATDDDAKPKRSYAASRRRESRIVDRARAVVTS